MSECRICRFERPRDERCITNCGHETCIQCVLTWLQTSDEPLTCMYCREVVYCVLNAYTLGVIMCADGQGEDLVDDDKDVATDDPGDSDYES